MQLSIEWLPADGPAPQLLILLHDRGGTGDTMRPLAGALHEVFPQAAILAPDAPGPRGADGVAGRPAWFNVAAARPDDDDESATADLAAGVDGAVPALRRWIAAQQDRLGVPPPATALAGLGQGAVLALAVACAADGLVGRVLAFGGRFARLPPAAPQLTTFHLLHGSADEDTPVRHARRALTHMGEVQGDATLDIAEGIGHGLHPALIDSALFRLRNHIPHRTWRAALGAVPTAASGAADPH